MLFKVYKENELSFKLNEFDEGIEVSVVDENRYVISNILKISPAGLQLYTFINKGIGLPLKMDGSIRKDVKYIKRI